MTHVILAMIQALLSMEKADEICSEDEQALWSHIRRATLFVLITAPKQLIRIWKWSIFGTKKESVGS